MSKVIDTGALLALVDRRDKYHDAAATYLAQQPDTTFQLPDLIFAETMTLVKARLGVQQAIVIGRRLRESNRFVVIPILFETVWQTFERFNDKAWSFPDCALWVLAQESGVQEIFSFDHHIDQMPGVMRVPST